VKHIIYNSCLGVWYETFSSFTGSDRVHQTELGKEIDRRLMSNNTFLREGARVLSTNAAAFIHAISVIASLLNEYIASIY